MNKIIIATLNYSISHAEKGDVETAKEFYYVALAIFSHVSNGDNEDDEAWLVSEDTLLGARRYIHYVEDNLRIGFDNFTMWCISGLTE